jgi:hypothetical protein
MSNFLPDLESGETLIFTDDFKKSPYPDSSKFN